MAASFRFPKASIEIEMDQAIAVRRSDGKFYRVTVQDVVDLAVSGGVSLPSITDDGTDVTADANLIVTGTLTIGDLPTSDPAVAGQLWMDTGVLKPSAG